MSLDDIIMEDRSTSGPSRHRGRRGGNRRDRRQQPYRPRERRDYVDLDSPWQHDMYDTKKVKEIDVPKKEEVRETCVLKVENVHWNMTEEDIREVFA